MLEDEPQVLLAEGLNLEPPDPLPVLMLKDRVGASADLWMEYGEEKIPFHDPMTMCKKRKREAEIQWEKDLLETDFIKKQVGSSCYFCPVDKVAKSLSFLLEIGWKVIDWKGFRVLRQTASQLEASDEQNAIFIRGKFSYEEHQVNLSSIVGSFNRKERFIQFSDNTVGLLPEKSPVQFFVEEGELVSDGIKIQKNRVGCLHEIWDDFKATPELENLKEKLANFQGFEITVPSEFFVGNLRAYQQQGVNWLSFLKTYGFHGILADEMGLGKTVQVLAFLSRMPLDPPALIVLPTSLLFNWRKEIETFLPHCNIYVHHGAFRSKKEEEIPASGIVLTSYTLIRRDAHLFKNICFSCLILDEAQAIKNEETKLAQILYDLKADFRLCITGTPIENHAEELWSHFHFLMPNLLGEKEKFQANLLAGESDKRHLKQLQRVTKPFILRRKKEEVAKDLPERVDQTLWMEMEETQRSQYESYLSGVRNGLLKKVRLEGAGKHRMEILETILRLRQICCHPQLVYGGEDTARVSTKLNFLLEDIKEIVSQGRKALIYSQFTSMLALISKAFKEKGWNFAYLDGTTTNREKVVEEFQQNSQIPLFLISLKAGGVGLNLTAADTVFIFDPWWNEAVEDQAISRAHRIGQNKTVIAKRYVIAESIEEKMMKLKGLKKQLAYELLENGSHEAGSLGIEDLEFLLS